MVPFAVVIDRKIDQNADTGFFDMIYKQVIPKTPAYMGENLVYLILWSLISLKILQKKKCRKLGWKR